MYYQNKQLNCWLLIRKKWNIPPKPNRDTKKNGLENASSFKLYMANFEYSFEIGHLINLIPTVYQSILDFRGKHFQPFPIQATWQLFWRCLRIVIVVKDVSHNLHPCNQTMFCQISLINMTTLVWKGRNKCNSNIYKDKSADLLAIKKRQNIWYMNNFGKK